MFIEIAISEARAALAADEVPVGAVIVKGGVVISQARNRSEELNDPCAHAEMLAIREACKILGAPRIPECEIFVTLEPCPMCIAAISFARIKRVYYGANDPKSGGINMLASAALHHKPEIYSGFAEKECTQLLKDFFIAKRNRV